MKTRNNTGRISAVAFPNSLFYIKITASISHMANGRTLSLEFPEPISWFRCEVQKNLEITTLLSEPKSAAGHTNKKIENKDQLSLAKQHN